MLKLYKKIQNIKLVLTVIFFISAVQTAFSQRIINDLETNTDKDMMQDADSTELDENGKKKKKIVPVDVKSWTIDDTYGNITPCDVDSLHHQYQNNNLNEGYNGEYNHLGNLGSPRMNRIFIDRPDDNEFIFINPFDMFVVQPADHKFFNTKSPLTNLSYNFCGSRNTGDDHFKAFFTRNINKRANFGFKFDYIYGQGYYDNQSTSFMDGTAWASYIGDRYDFHFYYAHNHMKMYENGGITDDTYITNPENITTGFSSNDIPTNLKDTWGKQEHDIAFFNHHYNLGFKRTEGDSTNLKEVFIPVTSFFHTFKLEKYQRRYLSYMDPSSYYTNRYLFTDTISDLTTYLNVSNTLGVSLKEGFNKYAAAGINAFVRIENQRISIPDTIADGSLYKHTYKDNKIYVGGQIIRRQGKHIHFDISGEYKLTDIADKEMKLEANGEANFRLFKDTAQVYLNASYSSNDIFYYNNFHSALAWWDQETDKEKRSRIQAIFDIAKTDTRLTLSLDNVNNYLYFQRVATPVYNTSGDIARYTYSVVPSQHSKGINILTAKLEQNFKLGILHLDNIVTFQKTSDDDILPLPTISLYHNLYLKFAIAKVLNCEFGADMKYFSKYYAPDYSPIVGNFANQSENTKMKIGGYPLITAYINFHLKRTRFYVMYYHLNQSDGKYFWGPHYPIAPKSLRFGLSWNFYN